MGGIQSAEDALKFLLCGARAVQVGTANYLDPGVSAAIADGMQAWAEAHGVGRLADLVGTLEMPGR